MFLLMLVVIITMSSSRKKKKKLVLSTSNRLDIFVCKLTNYVKSLRYYYSNLLFLFYSNISMGINPFFSPYLTVMSQKIFS